jgi:hypothetical protein
MSPSMGAHVAFKVRKSFVRQPLPLTRRLALIAPRPPAQKCTSSILATTAQLVQLSAAYTPEISAYYEGVITTMDDAAISFRLLKPAPPPPQGEEKHNPAPSAMMMLLSKLRFSLPCKLTQTL